MTYPLHLSIAGKRALVVGAGPVAVRRVDGLLRTGADVVVVAPDARPEILRWAEDGRIAYRARTFDYSDVLGAWLVHATTDDPTVNASVAAEATRRRIWSVRADEADLSSARTPAVLDLSGAVVSVSTGDPRRSAALRDGIGARLASGELHARPRRPRASGSVVLIGGGPGDPDLVTVRGRRELLEADVIVYDRLAPLALLDEVDPGVELIDAGKSPGHHALTQDQINDVLVARARQGLRVARFKGGDPFVLGRGSEEVLACDAAGIPVEVVPGISSAVAGPAAAGIPVTHRGLSSGFVVLSGHVVGDVEAVARTGLTVVVLMGVATLPELVGKFVAAGRAPSTPVAIVHRASTPEQRVVVGTLADIEARRAAADVANPSVIVIGDVVSVAPALAWELAS